MKPRDVVFDIMAIRRVDKDGFTTWNVSFCNDECDYLFIDDEWQAFKSLLQPSTKADFTITEIDEKGNKI